MSLLPKYKDAIEQLKITNEEFAKRIEELEKTQHNQSQASFDPEDQRMAQFEMENTNLKEERAQFVNYIHNLEMMNKQHEKVITYLSSTH